MMGLRMARNSKSFEIPDFLKVDRKEAERRRQWNADHPIQARSFTEVRREVDETVKALNRQIEKEADAAVAERNKRLATKKVKARVMIIEPMVIPPGYRWDGFHCQLMHPKKMSRSNYARLRQEMPTDAHRKIFEAEYGPWQGTSGGSDITAASRASAKSRAKPAGQPRKLDGPRAQPDKSGSHAAPVAPAARLKRGGKPEQVAAVAAMLTRPEGATLSEIGAQFGWLDHTTSAYISVNFRNLGRTTSKATVAGRGTVYRLDPEEKK